MNVVRLSGMSDDTAEIGGREGMAAEPDLPVADAAKALGLSPATVRQYLSDHAAHIETCRRGRNIMILLRSFPTLAHIRDLRRRRLSKHEIERRLAMRDRDADVEAVDAKAEACATDADTAAALTALRKDFTELKRELRDNELVVRQSLSTILFLLEKSRKEIEFHATEERLANRERDFLLTRQEERDPSLPPQRKRRKGFRALLASMFLTPASSSR